MNLFDRVWHYVPSSKGPIKRCALVTELSDREDAVHLTVFARPDSDVGLPVTSFVRYVPVRHDYAGGPVATPFCTPMEPQLAKAKRKG